MARQRNPDHRWWYAVRKADQHQMSFGIPVRNGLGVGLLASTFLSSLRIGGRPAMSLNFIGTNSLDSRVTFTRATTATFVGSNGLIQTAAIDAPRFDYNPTTLAPKGLLIEESRTNLTLYSTQFDDITWTKVESTVSANTSNGPDGTLSADKFIPSTNNVSNHLIRTNLVAPIGNNVWSVFVAPAGYSWVRLLGVKGDGTSYSAYFNVTTGVVGTVGADTAATIEGPFANGFYRCSIASTVSSALALAQNQFIYAASADNTATFAGDGTSGYHLWGAQLETGSFPTSYIPTVLLPVARNADVAQMTGTNFSSWYNQSAGTFVLRADSYTVASVDFCLTANDGTNNNRFGFYRSSATVSGYIVTGGVTQMELTSSGVVVNTPYTTAAAATANNGNFAFNGSIGAGDTSITMPTVDRLSIGSNNGAGNINGHIRQIAYYNTRLSDTALRALSV